MVWTYDHNYVVKMYLRWWEVRLITHETQWKKERKLICCCGTCCNGVTELLKLFISFCSLSKTTSSSLLHSSFNTSAAANAGLRLCVWNPKMISDIFPCPFLLIFLNMLSNTINCSWSKSRSTLSPLVASSFPLCSFHFT